MLLLRNEKWEMRDQVESLNRQKSKIHVKIQIINELFFFVASWSFEGFKRDGLGGRYKTGCQWETESMFWQPLILRSLWYWYSHTYHNAFIIQLISKLEVGSDCIYWIYQNLSMRLLTTISKMFRHYSGPFSLGEVVIDSD